ncbi:hypothetical protein AAFP35_01055 [Gordonia sp. CPCC 206044]|uniref:hypothetical protein n=1 Tax=Gordonia sp. CPCC 206044 TaxID=3140793 RepID=UPI003AF36215
MTGASGIALVHQVHELTGFDAETVAGTGLVVGVRGIGGTGVSTLVEACRAIDSSIPLREGHWGPRPDDAGVGIALMVVDPTSSVGDEEKRAVDELRGRFGIVALVCTKIDAFWEWPRRLREHRALLDPRQELPVFAVSPRVALAGAVEESGVRAVLDWVREHLAAPDDLRCARARVAAALGAVEYAEDELVRATDPRDAMQASDALTRRRRVLIESRDRGRVDRLASARAGLARARGESMADVATRSRALAAAATDRSDAITPGAVDDYVGWLTGELATLRERVDQAVDDRIEEVRAAALVGVDDTAGGPDLGDADDRDPDPPALRPVPTGRRGGEDALLVLLGASTGVGVGRLIVTPMAAVHTLQWISMPLTLLLGVAVATWVIRVRRTTALRGEMRSWSSDAIVTARGRLEHRVGLRLSAAEPRLVSQITRHHDRRARSVTAEIAEIDENLRDLRSGDATKAEQDRLRLVRTARRDLAAFATALVM